MSTTGAPHASRLAARAQNAADGSRAATRGLFVTGTDTGIGKTRVAVELLRALVAAGFRGCGMKPIAAGFERGTNLNEDVRALRAVSNVDAALPDVNPYAYADAIAPHVAAAASGARIELRRIGDAYHRLRGAADAIVVEGAGGALVPIDRVHDMLDVAVACELPVLLVVGMRLGCLNHALLTALAIQRRGLVLAGWVANELPPGMPFVEQSVEALTERLGRAPAAIVGPGARPVFDDACLAMLGFAR
jgi:dethiobiotin synthetase